MSIRDMHYDFKQKLNKVDSQKYKNLLVPQIDWKLNEALELIIQAVLYPKSNKLKGIEINQRVKDDFRTLIVEQLDENNECIAASKVTDKLYKALLPTDYKYYVRSFIKASKGTCTRMLRGLSKQHGDRDAESSFSNASFEWEETNILFRENAIFIETDGTFTTSKCCLTYYKETPFMHNAQDFPGGSYKSPDKVTTYTGSQDCLLPRTTHGFLVDVAVLLTIGNILTDYNVKRDKITFTE